MKRRVTIYLDVELEEKLKNRQANLLMKSRHSISFSHVLNQTLRDALVQEEKLKVLPFLEQYIEKSPD